jgi:Tol biopolymer transport system component
MTRRWPALTDDLLRKALTEEPDAGLVELTFAEMSAAIERAPQHGRSITWPWSPAMPALGWRPQTRRANGLAMLVIVAMLLALTVALVLFVGSILRPASRLIAFDSGGDIFVANADGSGRRQLTNGQGSAVQPTFSPDGTRLAYESLDAAKGAVSLVVVDVDGAHRTVVASIPAVARASGAIIGWFRVAWSPDGRELVYTAPESGAQQIYIVGADGSSPHRVGVPSLEGHDATWSADGTMLAFLGGRYDPDLGIYIMSADGTDIRAIRPGTEQWAFGFGPPVWSPVGHWLAFTARPLNASQVFVVDTDNGRPVNLSNSEGFEDSGPAWSPDGSRLAWHRGSASGDGRFIVAASDGSGVLALPPAVDGAPAWAPDGKRLIGYGIDPETARRNRLFVIDVGGGGTVEIPAEPDGDASWQGEH